MKNFLVLFLMICSFCSFSQDKKLSYHFDYFTIYNYKESEHKNAKTSNILSFSNSKDSTYILTLTLKKEKIIYATLVDESNKIAHVYKLDGFLKNYDDVRLFNNASTLTINREQILKKFIYQVNYSKENNHLISIKTFKNNKKQKFVSEAFFQTKPSTLAKNQHYNLIMLFAPLWNSKFSLLNKEIIDYSYVMVNGKKKDIRTLQEITKTDFTINIDSTKNTQH